MAYGCGLGAGLVRGLGVGLGSGLEVCISVANCLLSLKKHCKYLMDSLIGNIRNFMYSTTSSLTLSVVICILEKTPSRWRAPVQKHRCTRHE